MARKLIHYVEISDDFNRDQRADETLEIAIDGTVYELDCTSPKAAEIREFLTPIQEVAHDKWRMPARPDRKNRKPLTAQDNQMPANNRGTGSFNNLMKDRAARSAIREWAKANGYVTPDTGQIRTQVLKAYVESNPTAYVPETTLIHAGLLEDAS